jgi:hypothetical protein
MLVADEAHYAKNPMANRTINLKNVCDKAERVLLMTGTPLENRLGEMRHLISLLNPEVDRLAMSCEMEISPNGKLISFDIFESVRNMGVEVNVTVVGERPSARGVDKCALENLAKTCEAAVERVTGKKTVRASASTDCNIPLSLGIAAVCFGVYAGGGAHTRTEWLRKDSLITGLHIAIETTKDLI